MVSRKWAQLARALQNKKYRNEHQLFLVEGYKSVLETIYSDYTIEIIFSTQKYSKDIQKALSSEVPLLEIDPSTLSQISSFKNNQSCLAIVHTKKHTGLLPILKENNWHLALDNIQDPGNLGTIIRICDWYNIKDVLCNLNTVDIYNPKVISSTMGSFTRANIYYYNLIDIFNYYALPVYGASMEGDNIHFIENLSPGIVLMGNEANGIHIDLEKYITKKIAIPKIGMAESLNVSVATGILFDNIARMQARNYHPNT